MMLQLERLGEHVYQVCPGSDAQRIFGEKAARVVLVLETDEERAASRRGVIVELNEFDEVPPIPPDECWHCSEKAARSVLVLETDAVLIDEVAGMLGDEVIGSRVYIAECRQERKARRRKRRRLR